MNRKRRLVVLVCNIVLAAVLHSQAGHWTTNAAGWPYYSGSQFWGIVLPILALAGAAFLYVGAQRRQS